jgi:hypothetical protein
MTRPPIVVRTTRIVAVLVQERHPSMHARFRRLGVGVLAALLATTGCSTTTHAATELPTFPPTSDGPVYLVDAINLQNFTPGSTLPWVVSQSVVLSALSEPSAPTDSTALESMRLPFVTGSLMETPFISAAGSERTPASWKAWSDAVPLNGKGSLLPNVTPSGLFNGAPADVKASGGAYSLGVAYADSPTHVTAAFFATINVDAGTGTWKFATPTMAAAASPHSR